MNSKELISFLQICKEKSITKAAKALFITPQGLSKIVKNLEAELNVPLFYRNPKGIVLTEYGKILEERAKPIIEYLDGIQSEFNHVLDRDKGKVSLASAYGILSSLSPDCIFEFRKLRPNIELNYSEYPDNYVDSLVLKGEVDLGLSVEPIDEQQFDKVSLCRHKLYLLVNKKNPLSQKSIVTFADLVNEQFILESKEFKLQYSVVKKCKEAGFAPNIIFETSGLSLCHKLVKQNKGISVSVDYAVQDIKYENVVAIPFKDSHFFWDVCIITKKLQQDSANVAALIKYLVEWSSNTDCIFEM